MVSIMSCLGRRVLIYFIIQSLELISTMPQDEVNSNTVDNMADSGDNTSVYFTLSTEDGNGIPISPENSTEYLTSLFSPGEKTKFIVHGWMSSEESDAVNFTAYEYRTTQKANIVKVDWSNGASYKFYPLSAYQVRHIGSYVANMVDRLLAAHAIQLDKLHLIGHSLGAHVMGNAGSLIKEGKPARITGLDPAKPGFEGIVSEEYRLDASDAEFVDVIHSAAGAAGYYNPLGHADFYPNGGSPPQPGCFDISAPWQLSCSHGRAYYYFQESIVQPEGFPAVQCDSWRNFQSGACKDNQKAFMGDACPQTTRGIFYLETNGQPPYAKGEGGGITQEH